MTTPLSTSNKQTYFPLKNLPLEVKADIVKRVHDTIVEEGNTNRPRLNREDAARDAAREAARGLARLNCVDHDLREVTKEVMNTLPEVEMPATSMSIRKMAGDKQFGERFKRLVKRHNHIEVPFKCLSPDKQKIVLDVLKTTQHLKKVKLDLRGVTLDASQTPKNQGTSANASRASWMLAWLRGMFFKTQPSLFQNLLTTIEVMSRDGNQSLDIDLDLSCTAMNDQDVTALAEELPQCKVSSLNLSGNKIGDDGAKAIANALPHSPLINLDLSYNHYYYNRMTDEGIIAIANALALRRSSLISLNLSSNMFGDASAIAIANALARSSLTSLKWWDNLIGNKGIIAIANALPHSPLTNLDLRGNQIGDEGAIALAKAVPDSKLTSLDVTNNKITIGSATKDNATQIAQQGPNPPTVYF